MKKSKETDKIIALLEAAGYEAVYVGGYVRDICLAGGDEELTAGDIDIATSATPDEMKEVFAGYRCYDTGIRHGTITVMAGSELPAGVRVPVEITTYRTESGYSDNRHPDSVEFVRSLEEDLSRRDFTINAMAVGMNGEIRDPFGGQDDIRRRLIRAVGDPDVRFNEDALRIMRALRFAATLETGGGKGGSFSIEAETEAAMIRNRELLKTVSAERIYAELKKLLTGANAGTVIRKYTEVLGAVLPELMQMKGFEQHNPYHRYDVLEHCIRAMENVKTGAGSADSFCMKFAALLHDVGKPQTFFLDENGIGHMYGHPAAGAEIAAGIMKRLKADRKTADHVCALIKHHDLVFQKDAKLLKRWMKRYSPEMLLEILQLKRADNFATGNMSSELADKFDEIERMIHEILEAEECFSLTDMEIDGSDLLRIAESESAAAGRDSARRSAGPWIGRVLDRLLEEIMDGRISNEKAVLEKRAAEIMRDEL